MFRCFIFAEYNVERLRFELSRKNLGEKMSTHQKVAINIIFTIYCEVTFLRFQAIVRTM